MKKVIGLVEMGGEKVGIEMLIIGIGELEKGVWMKKRISKKVGDEGKKIEKIVLRILRRKEIGRVIRIIENELRIELRKEIVIVRKDGGEKKGEDIIKIWKEKDNGLDGVLKEESKREEK